MAKAIMVQGTCSNAGKSLLCAALCRIFRQDGYRVAPFKAQNMALNSFITADGLEMGRAQVVQAEAAGIVPDVRMNPILLKPTSDKGSQVIVNGVSTGSRTAREYWGDKRALLPIVRAAYESLAAENDIIVIEGAGSPAEINLKQDDLVNMGMAKIADAPVLLVGDIDRGGVFAALYGTVKLLEPDEQARVKGLIINKFRGDADILRPGLSMLEELTGKPVAGVVPYGRFDIDDEDSLSERLTARGAPALVEIAVVRLPRLSNFTDFLPLSRIEGVFVRYAEQPRALEGADLIILPGTKNTLGDLKWLRESGMEAQLLKRHAAGAPVFGVCGGYQMLGQTVSDPENAEGGGSLRGVGLLPADTVFRPEKTTAQAAGRLGTVEGALAPLSGAETAGYEIHMGETKRRAGAKPLQTLRRGDETVLDGCQAENVYGTYLHGIFDAPDIAARLASALAAKKGVSLNAAACDTARYKEGQYDKLADAVRRALDMELIYRILEGKA
ncbi:MAG: cobyric acid synthase [Eubacteriales bacterium]|nr:cobyric acid synthase [Eubacteriales bacterium]